MTPRFDLYGALYLLCSCWHSSQWSRGSEVMISQAYRDGFADGWSDARDERGANTVEREDYYGREYARGYRDGAQTYDRRQEVSDGR